MPLRVASGGYRRLSSDLAGELFCSNPAICCVVHQPCALLREVPGPMSFVGRGSYFAAAVAGVASAFYIFEPEFIELKRQRDATAQTQAAPSSANSTPAAVQTPSPPIAASGRWQEMQSRDGRTYWMNLDTGRGRGRGGGTYGASHSRLCCGALLVQLALAVVYTLCIALFYSHNACGALFGPLHLSAGKGSWIKPQ